MLLVLLQLLPVAQGLLHSPVSFSPALSIPPRGAALHHNAAAAWSFIW
jgi:hypothetical protein